MKNTKLPTSTNSFLTIDAKSICNKQLPYASTHFDLLIIDADHSTLDTLSAYFDMSIRIFALVSENWQSTTLFDAKSLNFVSLFVPKQDFLQKKQFDYGDTVNLLTYLRSPKGCPWDRGLTTQQIRTNIIEEAYELVDAIQLNDPAKMTEETGDLLMQGIFVMLMQAQIGSFDEDKVFGELCAKLISRHTHIFGSDTAKSGADALSVWEANKQKEKKFATHTQNLNDVPKGMPSLMRAQKIGKRAAKAKFDFCNTEDATAKVLEEIAELAAEIKSKNKCGIEDEMGDLLFSITNLCRFLDVSAEISLNAATNRFVRRFEFVEKKLAEQNIKFEQADFDTTDKLWQEAKIAEKN